MKTTARVLKSDSVAEGFLADQFNFEDLRQRCDRYLEKVKEQAQQILAEAEKESERLRKMAIQEGLKQGLEKGLQQAEKESAEKIKKAAQQQVQQRLSKVMPALKAAADRVEQERKACLSRWDKQALQLSLAIAEKLTHRTIEQDPSVCQERVLQAIELAIGTSQITIEMGEADLKSLQEHQSLVTDELQSGANVRLIGNPKLAPGDFLIETDHGEIDGRVETQMKRITEELLSE